MSKILSLLPNIFFQFFFGCSKVNLFFNFVLQNLCFLLITSQELTFCRFSYFFIFFIFCVAFFLLHLFCSSFFEIIAKHQSNFLIVWELLLCFTMFRRTSFLESGNLKGHNFGHEFGQPNPKNSTKSRLVFLLFFICSSILFVFWGSFIPCCCLGRLWEDDGRY